MKFSKVISFIAVLVGYLSLHAPAAYGQAVSIATNSLPGGRINLIYSYPLTATGGNGTYSWSLIAGTLPPGISIAQNPNRLQGTPTGTGPNFYSITLRVASGAATADRMFQIWISPANVPLAITTESLPFGQVGVPYPTTVMQATGGTTYTWTALPISRGNQLPPGLTLSSTGTLSGTPTVAGNYVAGIVVSGGGFSMERTYYIVIALAAAAPRVNLSLADSAKAPATQTTITPVLAATYPTALTGTLRLTFTSRAANAASDPAYRFSNGQIIDGRSEIAFTVAANSTTMSFAGGSLGLQNGTTAGDVKIEVVSLRSGSTELLTTAQEVTSYSIAPSAPVITSVSVLSRNAGGVTLQIRGYSTSRSLTQATFAFAAASGTSITTGGTTTLPIGTQADNHYRQAASAASGGTFNYDQTFPVTGTGGADATSLTGVTITLTNAQGTSAPRTQNF